MISGIDQEVLLKNPLSIFDNENNNNSPLFSTYGQRLACPHSSDEDHTSDEDKSEDESLPIPEVLCNLKDIEVPIDNDIIFEVDENDSISISSPGTCTNVKVGDILVSVNDRFIKSYSEGQTILHEEINSLHSKSFLKLRILVGKTPEEIEIETQLQEEVQRQKNSLYYATNFYSLAEDTHQKHHYHMSLQYVQKAYQLAKAAASSASTPFPLPSPSSSSSTSAPLKRLSKLMACCQELQGLNLISIGQDIHSIESFQDAIAIRKRVYENDYHLSLYKSVDTLSRIYRRHSIFSQSLFYAQLLIDICNHNLLQHSSYMANALSNLAKIKKSQLLLNESFLLEIESFQLRVMIHGYEHESIGVSLVAIGKIKQSLGDLGKGTEEIYHKAIHIYQQLIDTTRSINNHLECPHKRNSSNKFNSAASSSSSSSSPKPSSSSSCFNHLGDVYSALSSFELQRKNHLKAEHYKHQEIHSRQQSKHITRALIDAYWEINELIEEKNPNDAFEFRVKAIHDMKRLYGAKNKRLIKMIREHEKKLNKASVGQQHLPLLVEGCGGGGGVVGVGVGVTGEVEKDE